MQVEWPVSGLGGHAYVLAAQPGSGAVAVGCGDHTLRLWRPAGGGGGGGAPAPEVFWQVQRLLQRKLPRLAVVHNSVLVVLGLPVVACQQFADTACHMS